MFTHTLNFRLDTGSGTPLTANLSVSAEIEQNLEVDIAGSATNQSVLGVELDVSQVASFVLASAKALDVYTNAASGSSPANHFSVPAGFPVTFIRAKDGTWKDSAGANVTVDITSLYVTNADAGIVTLKLRSLTAAT